MRGMIASYIAAVTAFVVVNLAPHFGNAWWVWLGPAIIGVPGIVLWQVYYRKKFGSGAAPSRWRGVIQPYLAERHCISDVLIIA